MEKLYELTATDDFDVIVVDTPPSRHALDFLDAPRRLTKFLDNRIFRIIAMPGRSYLKAVSFAAQALLKSISKVVGAEVVTDAMAFFDAFEGMEEGFRNRAAAVEALLAEPTTVFVLITTARRDAIAEARYFSERLAESGQSVGALVVNRLHPLFETGKTPASRNPGLDPLARNASELKSIAVDERAHVTALAEQMEAEALVLVPFLSTDVHSIEGLTQVGRILEEPQAFSA